MFKFVHGRTPKTNSNDKVNVNPLLDSDTHEKLLKLSISCQKSKTHMAYLIIKMAVNNESIIKHFQDSYNTIEQYRIIPVKQNGRLFY